MIIFWGSEIKEKKVEEGQFFCPNCRKRTSYSLIKLSEYFTLYFIPLFETETLVEYVQCDYCNGQYEPQILELDQAQIEALLA